MIFFTFFLPFISKSALHSEICYYYVHHLKGRIGFMSRKRRIFIALVLAFCQIFCVLHIPFKVVPDSQKDVQISSTVHHIQCMQNHQNPYGDQKVYNAAYFIYESITIFEIVKFVFENTKTHVYIWQLPRGNIGDIMMETN